MNKKTPEQKQATRLKNILNNAIDELGITQSELGKKLGIEQPRVSRILSNPLKVEFGTVLKLANAVGIDLVSKSLIE